MFQRGVELAELLDQLDGGLEGQLLHDLRQQLEEVELDDGVGREDHVRQDGVLADDWQHGLDVLEVGGVGDVEAGLGDEFLGQQDEEELEGVVEVVVEDLGDVEGEERTVLLVLLEREALHVLQLLLVELCLAEVEELFLVEDEHHE